MKPKMRIEPGEHMNSEKRIAEDTMIGDTAGVRLGPNRMPIFRPEAVRRHSDATSGPSVIATLILMALLICFTALGSYTKTETVKSVVLPSRGLVKVYWPSDAKIVARLAEAGARLKVGDSVARYQSVVQGVVDSRIETVTAPVSGVLYRITAVPGERAPGSAEFATIAPDGPLAIRAEISDQTRANLKPDTEIRLTLAGHSVGPESTINARVVSVAIAPTENQNPFVSQTGYTYTIVAELDMSDERLDHADLLGKAIEVKVPQESRKIYMWLFDPLKKMTL
jgi:hypothetical protein